MTLNRRHRKLYVRNDDGESVSIIDLNTNRVLRTLPIGNVPTSGCYSEAADSYYCGSSGIYVIDGAGDTVRSHIHLSVGAAVTTMLSVESHAMVMAGGFTGHGDSVFVIDVTTDSIVHALPAVGEPQSLVYSSATDQVYCSHYPGNVSVISGDGSRTLLTLSVPGDPFVMIAVPEFHRVFVGCLSSIWMYVIRDTVTGIGEAAAVPRVARRSCTALPNPFKNSLALQCDAKSGRTGSVTVLSLTGSPVRTLSVPAGSSRVLWDGRDNHGKEVSAGVYVVIPSWEPGERVRVVKTE
jgi:YVTN family beta-propeller protein